MKLKASTIFFNAFALSVMLLAPSLHVAFAQGDREGRAEELFREALGLSVTGDRESARLRLSEAMRLWMQIPKPEKAARAALQMGDSCMQAKRFQESLYYYERVPEVKLLSESTKAIAFNSIAGVYAQLYQRDLALRNYDEAIDRAGKGKDFTTQALALAGKADLYYQQGDRKQAIASVEQARWLNKRQGNEDAEADLLHLAGKIDQEGGLAERARTAFEEALAIYRRTGNIEGQVRVLCSISSSYLASAQKRQALEQAELAVDLAEKQGRSATNNAEKLRARELRWRASLSHAQAQQAMGETEKASRSFQSAIHHMEGAYLLVYRSTVASAVAFREELQVPYRGFVDVLIEQGKFELALEWVERAKARAIRSLIEARHAKTLPRNTDQDGALLELSSSIARLRTQLLPSDISQEQRLKLQKEISEKEYKMTEMQLKAEMERSRDQILWSQPATIEQLKGEHTILEYLLGEDRSFVWLISSKGVTSRILPGRKEIEREVGHYIELIKTAPNYRFIDRDLRRLRAQADKLTKMLLGSLSEHIEPGRKLIVVPDGLLHYLPFEALIRNERYLAQDHEISYLPAAGMLRLWQGPRSVDVNEPGDKMEFLGFGDPIFEPGLKAYGSKSSRSKPTQITRQIRISPNFRLHRLPWTRDEVKYIASLFPDRSRMRLDKDSTEEAVKRDSLRRYRRLHFATHSLMDEQNPSQSALVLTLDNDPEEDGFLEVSEITELDLDCDLVVLSACQTGRGQLLSGEGIMGLSYAFLRAGARSVVVSLWSVTDNSTSRLMKSFYEEMIGNTGNAAALRRAKLRMIESGKESRHPYYWAPFIIVGKP